MEKLKITIHIWPGASIKLINCSVFAFWVKYLVLYFPANTINLNCVTFNLRKGNLSQELERVHKPFAKNVLHHPLGKRSCSTEEKLLKNTRRITSLVNIKFPGKNDNDSNNRII